MVDVSHLHCDWESSLLFSAAHFRGFQGQTFDVVGHVGSAYSLIEDKSLSLRLAAFSVVGLGDEWMVELRLLSP